MKPTYTRVDLTPEQEKEWDKTRSALMWHCPAFTFILMTMMDKVGSKYIAVFTKDVPTAATDGVSLIINPEYFFQFPLQKRMFIVAHEIAHAMMNHMVTLHQLEQWGKVKFPDGTSLPFEWQQMNWSMDYVINDMLVNCKGEGSRPIFEIDPTWLHDTNIATANDSVIDAYAKVHKKQPPGGGGGGKKGGKGNPQGNQPPNGQQPFDQHLKPGTSQGKDPTKAAQERNANEWATAIQAAAQASKVQGKLPGALESFINSLLEPKVAWQDHIRGLFARKVGSGAYDWRKPDRRMIERDVFAPSRSGGGCGTIAVGIDTSGSVTDHTVAMFLAELAGMLEDLRPRKILVFWCDAEVHRVDEVEDAADVAECRRKGAPGRGGTSFIPVFNTIDKMGVEPDALVYLTDMYGSFPQHAPKYPTIWGSISKGVSAPFGDVVEIPQGKE